MKKIFLIAGLLSLVVLFGLPGKSSAAVTATENFDSYSASTTLNGNNGGFGWTGSWTVANTPVQTDVAPVGGQGSIAFHSQIASPNSVSRRNFNPISAGVLHYQFYMNDITQGNLVSVILADTTNTGGAVNSNRAAVYINKLGNGTIEASDGQTYNTIIGSYSTSTWNTIDIKFDNNLGNVFQVSVNGGPYSGNFTSGGSFAHIDQMYIYDENTSAHDFWVDDILIFDNSVTPPSSITGSGTSNRIAKFTGSTTIGDSLLSDDGTNTTLTSGNLLIPTGSIGIGTSTPSTKLYVNGDLFANWIKVAANSFGLDTFTSGTLYIGSTTASSIKIGRSSIITTIFGTTTTSNLLASTATISGKLIAGITTLGNTTLGVLNANSVIASGSLSATSITTGTLTATTSATINGSLTASSTTVSKLNTSSNCASSISPAICGSAPSGSVAMAGGSSTLVVNTTAVTANSQILVTRDASLGSRLGVTCNTNTTKVFSVSARASGTSFTISANSSTAGNPMCLSYWIIN